ncbi:MAG: signal peptidase I [Firmicutes bacterium]|nr:signal peptidase I [Bacillota bacterium]
MEHQNTPSIGQLEQEFARENRKKQVKGVLKSTLYILASVAAVVIILAMVFFPVLKIYGTSMTPTLDEGQYVLAAKGATFNQGDIIAFYYNNQILVKRVIAFPGDWVDVREDGTVIVNGEILKEDYLSEKHQGITDLNYPYQVPESTLFVMGDHRMTSVDSRSSSVGCIPEDNIVGKIFFRVWPIDHFNKVG